MTATKTALYGDPTRRPPRPVFNGRAVPSCLKPLPQWVAWRYQWREDPEGDGGEWAKVPRNLRRACERSAKSDDPTTWTDYADALVRAESLRANRDLDRIDGLGFVFVKGGGLFGLDIDGCRDPKTGELSPFAAKWVAEFATYADVSPSGTGIKLFCRGKLPWDTGRKVPVGDGQEIELYEFGRYFTITGKTAPGSVPDVADCQAALARLVAEVPFPERKAKGAKSYPASEAAAPVLPVQLSDEQIIGRITRTAKNAAKGAALWGGDTSRHGGDHSKADAALCDMIAFYTGPDPGRIDAIFRQSGLMREKWHRDDYREMTIDFTLAGMTRFYNPSANGTGKPHAATPPADGSAATAKPGGSPTRVPIRVTADEHVVNDAVAAALVGDPDLFVRAGDIVRVVFHPATERDGVGFPAGPRIVSASLATLRERMSAVCYFYAIRGEKREEVQVHPPEWAVPAVRDRETWAGMRHLEAVVDHPIVRADGSLVVAPGYDAATGVFHHASPLTLAVPDSPTAEDARRAVAVLYDVIADFPLPDGIDKAGWLAALLTPLARFAFRGPSPLFLFDGNIRGAGKGLIADAISLIVNGREFAVTGYTPDDEEMRKKITAIAAEGDRMVLLDNIDGKFGGSSIDRVLTSTVWKDRILGKTQQIEVPMFASWYATGNNVQLAADSGRRVQRIRLQSDESNPEDRSNFVHKDLRAWVRANRDRLLSAALTILCGYLKAGRPAVAVSSWGSYEGWSAVVRAAVVWAGEPDPGRSRDETRKESDAVAGPMEVLVHQWAELADGLDTSLTAGQIIKKVFPINPENGRPMPTPDRYADIAEAIESLISSRVPAKLGYKLRHYKNRPFGNLRIVLDGSTHGMSRWKVEKIPDAGAKPSSFQDFGD
jgi:hypothetical protein